VAKNDYNPEHLKPLIFVGEPDPRTNAFVRFDPQIKDSRPITLEEHHADITQFALSPAVPEKIVTHFETAKNIYLYAWFVYRFYSVADLHVKTTLEFALKERIGEGNLRQACNSVGKKTGLNGYILYAIKQGWVLNEGFDRWWSSARRRAENRATIELIKEMDQKGLEEAVFDPTEVEITEKDKDWDLVTDLSESIPKIRNEYAHGSSMLHNQVLGTFEIVSEFINQLWPTVPQSAESGEL
jgi:hypothetical protein